MMKIVLMKIFRDSCPGVALAIWLSGSEACETLFRDLGGWSLSAFVIRAISVLTGLQRVKRLKELSRLQYGAHAVKVPSTNHKHTELVIQNEEELVARTEAKRSCSCACICYSSNGGCGGG